MSAKHPDPPLADPPWPAPRRHDSIGSTQTEAVALARAGAPHGSIVTAARQTGGRGRMGRVWASPPGNLYASFVLRPAIPAARAAGIGFVAALAVADLVDAVLPGRALLKWPNDVLLDGAKLSGMLAERGEGDPPWIVLGIGVNIAAAPQDLAYRATSLHAEGAALPVADALELLAAALRARLACWRDDGFARIRRDWLARAHAPGTALRVAQGAATLECRFEGLDEDGALLVATADGRRRIVAGDVALAPP